MLDIRRREFITLIGGAAVALPLATRAQQPASARLGVLLYSNPTADPQMRTVLRALGDLGYVEGRNIDITYRYARRQR
jgi:putative tryptophan/tyrosine transport system substrate-binding protein